MNRIFEKLTEFDINPVVVFEPDGRLVYYNREAEILLAAVSARELYQFGLERLPAGDGEIKVEFEPFQLGGLEFNGWWVGVEGRLMGVKLLVNTSPRQFQLGRLELVDLPLLLEWAKDYFTLNYPSQKWELELDPSLPPFYFNKREFISLLKKMVAGKERVKVKTGIVVGEYVKLKNRKYPTLEIRIEVNSPIPLQNPYFDLTPTPTGYRLRIPLIKEENETAISGHRNDRERAGG
jgi:hypothetical protein